LPDVFVRDVLLTRFRCDRSKCKLPEMGRHPKAFCCFVAQAQFDR